VVLLGSGRPGDEDLARAYIDVERLLDRIRRGEISASELEQARLRRALDALRALRRADAA
jgi:hypothetical protein